MEEYFPLVAAIARNYCRRLKQTFEYEEIYSAGLAGLWDATKKFKPNKGKKFSSYAYLRIRGEIIDYVRTTNRFRKGKTVRIKAYSLEDYAWFMSREADFADFADFVCFERNEWEARKRDTRGNDYVSEQVEKVLACLTKPERDMMRKIARGERFADIAATLGICQSRVSQKYKQCLEFIRKHYLMRSNDGDSN